MNDIWNKSRSYISAVPRNVSHLWRGQGGDKAAALVAQEQPERNGDTQESVWSKSMSYVTAVPQGIGRLWSGEKSAEASVDQPEMNADQARNEQLVRYGKVALVAAAPIAVVALTGPALGVVGFGADGILKGSYAASIMSWYGGNVAAGSACAVMQSVGAAGVGSTAYAAAAGTGAVVGAYKVKSDKDETPKSKI